MGDSLFHDIRYAARTLRRNRGFTAIAVLTLALGIGANTAIFSVVNSALLKPLPYERPHELALIWSTFHKMGATRAPAAGAQLKEIRERTSLFQDVAGIWVGSGTFTGEAEPEQVKVGYVTHNFFSVLEVSPALGRAFLVEDEAPGSTVIMLSHALWQRRFGGNPYIVGSSVRFGGGGFTVVGVLPEDFQLSFPPDANVPANIQAWVPFSNSIYANRTTYYIRLLGRMKPGVTAAQAQEETGSIAGQLRDSYTEYNSESLELTVVQLHSDLVRDIRPALMALFIGAGLVLLISCLNVANLLLTRASARGKEMALRLALGASIWRIGRELLFEALLICAIAGATGLALAQVGLELILSIRPDSLVRIGEVSLDLTVLAFVGVASLGSGLVASMAPIFETRKLNLSETLKQEGRSSAGRIRHRTRSLLIVSEVALGFVLLVSAGLMVRTLIQLHTVSPGFDPANALTFEINPPGRSGQERNNFVMQWEQRVAALPGVEVVGAISHLPLDDYPNWYSPYAPEGLTDDQSSKLLADHRTVTPGYFQAIGARLVEGRYFTDLDNLSGRSVVIVDDLLARETWPGERAVGKKLRCERFTDRGFAEVWTEVVGVVENIKSHSLLRPLRGQIYMPYAQSSREHLSFVVRTAGDPLALASSVRAELPKLDKDRAMGKLRPMTDYVTRAMAPTNFIVVLAGIFAGLALLLATIGIYGVISYSVSQRSHEIGVRMALGARPSDIQKLVLSEGMAMTVLGLGLGFASSLVTSRYLQSLLFQVPLIDPATYGVMIIAVLLATILACWRPAHKASSVSPMQGLRR